MTVRLRLLDPDRDGSALHAIFGDEESCRYMTKAANASVEQTIRDLKTWNETAENTTWAIVEHEDGEALGRLTMIPRGMDVWETGIMTASAARGRGLAAAALREAIDLMFDDRGARRIYADIDPDNRACLELFKRLGFTKEGHLRGTWITHLGVRDAVIMGLLASDPRPWRE